MEQKGRSKAKADRAKQTVSVYGYGVGGRGSSLLFQRFLPGRRPDAEGGWWLENSPNRFVTLQQ